MVHVPLTVCPDCGGGLVPMVVMEPALLRHGGYGETIRRTSMVCLRRCGWWLSVAVESIRPAA